MNGIDIVDADLRHGRIHGSQSDRCGEANHWSECCSDHGVHENLTILQDPPH